MVDDAAGGSSRRIRVVGVHQIHDPSRGMFTIGLAPHTKRPKWHMGLPVYKDGRGELYVIASERGAVSV